jgi:hypothetical protein
MSELKHYVSKVLRLRLDKHGGELLFPLLTKNSSIRWADENQESIIFDAIGYGHKFDLEIFDAVLHKANDLGGEMYIASYEARQKGTRLGNGVPLDSIDGFIAYNYTNTSIGKGVLACGSYVAALLVHLGVCKYKETTTGRYIQVLDKYKLL